MRSWLQDPDGDGTYTLVTTQLPAGSYEVKVAHDRSWDENYGDGGVPNGANIASPCPAGKVVTISFNSSTKKATVAFSDPAGGSGPDLSKSKAVWVAPCVIAWPGGDVPAGEAPAGLRWRLHVDDEPMTVGSLRIVSDGTRDLVYSPAGLPASVLAAHPELEGYLALRPEVCSRGLRDRLGSRELAVGQYLDSLILVGGTGVEVRG